VVGVGAGAGKLVAVLYITPVLRKQDNLANVERRADFPDAQQKKAI
jgi:hypothetical protein